MDNFKPVFVLTTFFLIFLAVPGTVSSHGSSIAVLNSSNLSAKSTFSCFRHSDCSFAGPNSRCFQHHCICNLGYRSINSYCTKQNCTLDSDCTRFFYNTRCSRFFNQTGSCVCISGTHLDYYSQTCLYNSRAMLGLYIGLPLGLIALVIFLSCCCVCCCKRRRQARIVVVPQQAAPPSPVRQPLPPVYQGSYQNMEKGYQQPNALYPNIPPQYQQVPPPPPYNPGYGAVPTNGTPVFQSKQ